MSRYIDVASLDDIDALISLYVTIYGATYPYAICTDRDQMAAAISSEKHLWLVTRDKEKGNKAIASAIFEIDTFNKIAKLAGVAVNTGYRGEGLAHKMIEHGSSQLICKGGPLNSIYTTTRTIAVQPQLMCLKAGFKPYGIFPNSHKLTEYETTTLLIKFKEGVLERRHELPPVPEQLAPIIQVVNDLNSIKEPVVCVDKIKMHPKGDPLEFEIFTAPKYVKKKFVERFKSPYDRFYPFHTPNTLMVSTNGEVKIFAYLSRKDRYCALIAITKPIFWFEGRLSSLLRCIEDEGASYVEILMGVERTKSIQTLLNNQFLPSAIYPAMQDVNETLYDFVVMSRTLETLNFKGIALESQFKPFIDQYVNLWKSMHLDSMEVFDDYQ